MKVQKFYCPFCKKEIHDGDQKCIFCQQDLSKVKLLCEEQKEAHSKKGVQIFFFFLFFFFVVLFLCFFFWR